MLITPPGRPSTTRRILLAGTGCERNAAAWDGGHCVDAGKKGGRARDSVGAGEGWGQGGPEA